MQSKIPEQYFDRLTIRDLEELLERKKKNESLADLLRERDRLRLELKTLDDRIEAVERTQMNRLDGRHVETGLDGSRRGGASHGTEIGGERTAADGGTGGRSFLAGKRKRNLKDYIAQVLLEADGPLSPSAIQKQLPEVGYVSNATNPRSFYNTVFQALQRYDIFEKESKKYRLSSEALRENGVREILPKKKTRLKDYITEVLDKADGPLKVSEIASRVVIAGYDTDLEMDALNQRVSATLKKYLNRDFDWDSQRYRLANRGPLS